MNKVLLYLTGLCMCLSMAQTGQAAETGPIITRLANGLTLLVLEDRRFPLVSTRLYVHAGSAYEDPKQAGISHVLEHMVFKGTEKRPKGQVASVVESQGGYLNAATSFDYTMYLTDMPSKHWRLGMDVVRDMAFHPALDADELESEKKVIVAELKRGQDSPGSVLFENLHALTLAKTPYERPIIGYEETINALSVQNLRDYINRLYQPQSMLLVVVGDVDPAEVLAEAKTQFGAYDNNAAAPLFAPINPEELRSTKNVQIKKGPWNKVYVSLALPVPGLDDTRSATLDVLAHLLGGDATSLFYRKYRYEQQLVHSISVSNLSFERVGLLYIGAELDADKLETFWQALTRDLASLNAEQFSKQDIERAQLQMEDGLFRSKETLSGLASKLGSLQFFAGNATQAEQNILNLVRSVDHKQLAAAISDWIVPERLHSVVLAPEQSLLPDMNAILATNWAHSQTAQDAGHKAAAKAQETISLGQGRTLVLQYDATLPYVSAQLSFKGGDSLLEPDKQGLAALAARTLTKGAGTMSRPELETWLSERAASLVASASRQSFSVGLSMPSRFSEDLFGIVTQIIQKPVFAAEEIEREKTIQIAGIKSTEDQALGMAFRRIPGFLFPKGPYSYVNQGYPEQLAAFSPQQVRDFWALQQSQQWVLSVTGQFDREAILKLAKELPKPTGKAPNLTEPQWNSEKKLDISMPGREQAHLLLVFPTVPEQHADAPGLSLLTEILAGQSGLLFSELRDNKGLGYTVTAFERVSDETGYLIFYIGTAPDKLEAARQGFADVIASLHKEALPAEQLDRGKNLMEGEYYRERQSLYSRAAEGASLTLFGKALNYASEQIKKSAAFDQQALLQLAQKYLNMDRAYVITVKP